MENDNSDRIKLNVGGKLFETTISTLQSGGPDSLLSALSTRHVTTTSPFNNNSLDSLSSALSTRHISTTFNNLSAPQSGGPDSLLSALSTRHVSTTSPFNNNLSALPDSVLSALSTRHISATSPFNNNNNTQDRGPIFIDRDPEIFTVLLSLLRTNRLPSSYTNTFSVTELTEEAEFYGIENILKEALKPNKLSGIDASIVKFVNPASDGLVTDFHVVSDGAVFIAHGGQVTVYDSGLSYVQTVRTHLDSIGSVRCVESGAREVVAVASEDVAGVHFYDMVNGKGVGTVEWRDASDPRIYKARVTAFSDSEDSVFAACESYHKENCVLVVDKETLRVKGEIGRQSGSSAKFGVPRGLSYVEEMGVLVGTSVTSGAFGYSGYVRLWDVRSGRVVWETNEPGSGRSSRFGDSFADVSVDVNDMSMCKICSNSGDLGIADLRKLGDDPWVYLRDMNPSLRDTSGAGVSNSVVHCYNNQVFVGRDGGLEVWSRVAEKGGHSEIGEESFRRNYMDKAEDSERGIIKKIEGGGERLFVSRECAKGLERVFSNYEELVADYAKGDLHPGDLKPALSKALNKILQDQVLSEMQEKLDNLCEQVNYFKDKPDISSYNFESSGCGCRHCDYHQPLLKYNEEDPGAKEVGDDEMIKFEMVNDVEQEERRMSNLSDWAPSVSSSTDVQWSTPVDQDIGQLQKECEEKDATIKELSTFLNSAESHNSKRISELEDIIRRKNMLITKLRKDMMVLEQKVIHLTRLRRPSSSKSSSSSKKLPVMSDNLIYDIDSITSPSDDSDSSTKKKHRAPMLSNINKEQHHAPITSRQKPTAKSSEQPLRPIGPLKERSLNQQANSAVFPKSKPKESRSSSGGSKIINGTSSNSTKSRVSGQLRRWA